MLESSLTLYYGLHKTHSGCCERRHFWSWNFSVEIGFWSLVFEILQAVGALNAAAESGGTLSLKMDIQPRTIERQFLHEQEAW